MKDGGSVLMNHGMEAATPLGALSR